MKQVVIIGGGVIGLATAYALDRAGARVTVLSAGEPGVGASAVNAGWIVPSLSSPVPAPGLVRTSLRWMMRSDSPLYIRPRPDPELIRWLVTFWRRCNANDFRAGTEATAELNRQTMQLYDEMSAAGVAFEQHRAGLLNAYLSQATLERELRDLEPLRAFGIEIPPPLTRDDVRTLEPNLTETVNGGFWIKSERHVRPDTLTAGLVAYLAKRGVAVRSHQRVTAIEQSNGRVTAVRTEIERIATDATVICAGAWSGEVARLAGVKLPMQGGKGYSLDYTPAPVSVNHALYFHELRVAVTPLNGMTRLAGTMEFSGLNDTVRPARVAAIARAGAAAFRGWPADPGIAKIGHGHRPMTPDGLPAIGWLPGFTNLAVASGHAMLGITLAPATGAAIAELLSTGRAPDAIVPFDPARFSRKRA